MPNSVRGDLPYAGELREERVREKIGDEIINVRYPVLPGEPEASELCRRAAMLTAEAARLAKESAVLKCRPFLSGGSLFVELSGFSGRIADCAIKKLWLIEFRDGKFASARRLSSRTIDKKRRL